MTSNNDVEKVMEALRSIPTAEKKAYTEAMERAPMLVEIESNPERYLKFLNFDHWAAARRIIDYWSVRVELFGPRAFLPLVLTGEGALSEEDLQVFRTGSFMLLPRTSNQVPVLLYDPARLTTTVVTDATKRLRCLFYFLNAVSETDSSLVSLSLYNSRTRKATFDLRLVSDSVSYFGTRQVIPVRVVEAHMIMIATGFESVVSLTLRELTKVDAFNPCKVFVYDQKPMEQIQAEMKSHGFTLEGLPRVPFDGLFSFGCFRRWMAERDRKASLVYDSKPSTLESPEEVEARKRRQMEAANARRKRARKKIEMNVLRSEVDRLMKQKKDLLKMEAELTSKVDDARLIVRLFARQGLPEGEGPPALDGSHLMVLGSREFASEVVPESRLASSTRESPSVAKKARLAKGTSSEGSSERPQAAQDSLSSPPCCCLQENPNPPSLSLLPLLLPSAAGGTGNLSTVRAPVDPVGLLLASLVHEQSHQPKQAQRSHVQPQMSPIQGSTLPTSVQPPTQPPVDQTNKLALLQGILNVLSGSR